MPGMSPTTSKVRVRWGPFHRQWSPALTLALIRWPPYLITSKYVRPVFTFQSADTGAGANADLWDLGWNNGAQIRGEYGGSFTPFTYSSATIAQNTW